MPVFLPGESHDRGAWWAMVHTVPKSRTRLKRLSTTQHGGNLELNYIFKDSSLFFANKGTFTVFRMCIYLLGRHHSPHYRPWLLRHLPTKMPSFYWFFSFLNLTSQNNIILQVPMKWQRGDSRLESLRAQALRVGGGGVQSLSRVWIFVTPWAVACQASLSFTISWTLLKLKSIESVSVMPSDRLILCHPLLFLSSILPSIKVFSNESSLRIRWPKY